MKTLSALILSVLMASPAFSLSDKTAFTLCTWNIEHLAEKTDTGCRPRKDAEYLALQHYVAGIDADIIAFQEVENRAAAEQVFDPAIYRIEISGRPDIDLGVCRKRNQKRRMQRTGFAIRKDIQEKRGISVQRMPDVESLACTPSERWGVHVLLTFNESEGPETAIHLLCVHLKSGCAYKEVAFKGNESACSRLAEQVPRLESWMDARATDGEDFIVLGDVNRQLDGLGDSVWAALDDSEVCTWETPETGLWHCKKGSVRYSRISDLERARSGRKHPYPHYPRYPYAVDHIIMSFGTDLMGIEPTARFIRDELGLSDHSPLVMRFHGKMP